MILRPNIIMDTVVAPENYRFRNLAGKTFDRLTVMFFFGLKDAGAYYMCRCECSGTLVVSASKLRSGHTRSCGCLLSESGAKCGREKATHGESKKTAEYRIWTGMKTRCFNPNIKAFKYYGGRGITVCDRWRNSFPAFLEDVGRRPSDLHSIDRWPNNDGNYEPGNVRWATWSEQNRNKRPRK